MFFNAYVDAVAAHAWEAAQTVDVPVEGGMIFATHLAEPRRPRRARQRDL